MNRANSAVPSRRAGKAHSFAMYGCMVVPLSLLCRLGLPGTIKNLAGWEGRKSALISYTQELP
jgi:hypothetical protein